MVYDFDRLYFRDGAERGTELLDQLAKSKSKSLQEAVSFIRQYTQLLSALDQHLGNAKNLTLPL